MKVQTKINLFHQQQQQHRKQKQIYEKHCDDNKIYIHGDIKIFNGSETRVACLRKQKYNIF